MYPFEFDFKKPNYLEVFDWRFERLNKIRRNPEMLPALKLYYREHIAEFITDWGCTADPRHVEVGLPTVLPFILFPRQEEWVWFTYDNWKKREFCVTAKSRDMGISWLSCAFAVALCVLYDGVIVGFGSRKEEYVDKIGNPKSLFYKIRQFTSLLPREFRKDWNPKVHAPYMRILYPDTNSVIVGEAGDNIGRGDRTSLHFLDEAAHFPRPELVEASLSNTTNCRHDISTPNGPNNPFARKVMSGKIPYFPFHWTQDPRKDQAWYEKIKRIIDDSVIIAQEVDLDFNASVEGVIIPAEWVQAAIDAHVKLGFKPVGPRCAALDVADGGKDLNAYVGTHGVVIEFLEKWSGRDQPGRIYDTTKRAMAISLSQNYASVEYDADGLGASVRGDAYTINKEQEEKNRIKFIPFTGSGKVADPLKYPFRYNDEDVNRLLDRTNEDLFENAKAQGWFYLQHRFKKTFLALRAQEDYRNAKQKAEKEGIEFLEPPPVFDDTELISISSTINDLWILVNELSQPQFVYGKSGRLLVDKTPDGSRSPNCADAVMIRFSPKEIRKGFFDV